MSFRLPMVSRFLANRKRSQPTPRRRARHSISLGCNSHLLEERRMLSGNQPPVASALDFFTMDEDSVSEPIDVARAFEDPDNWSDELTFSIVDGVDPELTRLISLDETGQLMIYGAKDAFGFGALTIRCTDPSGEWAETVLSFEIIGINDPPVITSFTSAFIAGEWRVSGTVTDVDDPVEGFTVNFSGEMGAYFVAATVEADGSFTSWQASPGTLHGNVTAITQDPQGLESNLVTCLIAA